MPQTILDGDAAFPQGMRKLKHRGEIVAADRDQKGAELDRRLGCHAALLEELAEHNISHPEPQGGKVEEAVISAAAGDRTQSLLRVEQLEHDARVIREPPDDRQVDRDEITEAHTLERLNSLAQGLGEFARGRS